MKAWKFLAPGAIAPFTGARWPLPRHDGPGDWVEGHGVGVHACSAEDLPYWIDEELWLVELDGAITRLPRQLVATRGRLVRKVDAWPGAREAFTAGCVVRTRTLVADALRRDGHGAEARRLEAEPDLDRQRDLAAEIAASGPPVAGYVFDAIRRQPYPGLCSYIAANAAAAIDGQRGYDRERTAQVQWFADSLHLDAA